MFDIGMAEMIVIGGAAVLLLGKNDMPLVFRLVGRGVGKVSGLVQGGQARMGELSKGSELLQLQNEIRSNLDDLRVIKAELRGAARLPAGITGSSHPGSSALREQPKLSGQADQPLPLPSPHDNNALGAGYVSPGGGGQYSHSLPTPTTTASAIRPPSNELPTVNRPPGVSSGRIFDNPAATTLGERGFGGDKGETAGGVSGGGGGRVGDGLRERAGGRAAPTRVGVGMGAGVGTGVGAAVPRAAKSVVSPGGDRLQRLAMAEISFAEKELYAPKTDALPGGADILNETITDSLLQERYRKMLDVARDSKSKDGAHNPRS